MRGLLIALILALPCAATAQDQKPDGAPAAPPLVVEPLASSSDTDCLAVCRKSFNTVLSEEKDKALLKSCEFIATCTSRLLLGPNHYTAGTNQGEWNSLDMFERWLRGDTEIKG